MQNLWQQSHTRIATSHEPPKKPTEAMKEAGRIRRRIDRHIYDNTIRGYLSANAELAEWEELADELEAN